jgi:hypothetical protein
MGMQIRILNASTIDEIDAAFATLARDRPDALFVTPNTFSFRRARRSSYRAIAAGDDALPGPACHHPCIWPSSNPAAPPLFPAISLASPCSFA